MSTHREIEEVYLEDIIKIQKSTKSIVAEHLGEIQGEMRYNPKKCDNYLPAGKCKDDGGKATCLAHIAEGRIHDCILERDGESKHYHWEPKKTGK